MTTRYNTPSFKASPRAVATDAPTTSRNPNIKTVSNPPIIERRFEGNIPVTVYAPQNERRSYRFNNGYQAIKSDVGFWIDQLRNA